MSSGSHNAANLNSKQPREESQVAGENGLKVKISLSTKQPTKETKTSTTKPGHRKSSAGPVTSSTPPVSSPGLAGVLPKPLLNGNRSKIPSTGSNAIRPKPSSPGKAPPPPASKVFFNGSHAPAPLSSAPSPSGAMGKAQCLFFGSPHPVGAIPFPPPFGSFSQANGKRLGLGLGMGIGQTTSTEQFMSQISEIITAQKILPKSLPNVEKTDSNLKSRKEPVPIRPATGSPAGRSEGRKTVPIAPHRNSFPALFLQQPPLLLAPTPPSGLISIPNSVIFPNGSTTANPQGVPKRRISPSPRSISGRNKITSSSTSSLPKLKPVKKRKNEVVEETKKLLDTPIMATPGVVETSLVATSGVVDTPIVPLLLPSSNEGLDELLSSVQTNMKTQEFGVLRENLMSPTSTSASAAAASSSLSLSLEEMRARLKKIRKSMKVVDLGLEEDVKLLADLFERKVVLSTTRKKTDGGGVKSLMPVMAKSPPLKAAVETSTGETSDEPVCVLPFKKRQYRSVPSPKTKDQNDGSKSSGKEGRAATATPSRSSSVLAKSKDAPSSAVIVSASVSSPKQPSLKMSFKLNSATGKPAVVCTSPQSTISVTSSSPKSTSTSPAGGKKRKAEAEVEVEVEGSGTKRKTSTPKIKFVDGLFSMTCNTYSEARLRKPHPDTHLMQCDCKPPPADRPDLVGCGADCASRNSFIECDPESCPCGARCSNQTIQKGLAVPDLELFQTKQKGQGVRCKSPIKKGTFICEYVGEVLSMDKFRERMTKVYNQSAHHYCLKLDGGKVIDAYRCGSIARFINHSCEPNSQPQKWLVNGQDRMAIFAKDNIPAGEEITYDYKFESFDVQQKCFCGKKSCRGFTGIQKSQKLNGLLMKKRQSTTPSVATPTRAASPVVTPTSDVASSSSSVMNPKPDSLPVSSKNLPSSVANFPSNGSELVENFVDPVREKQLILKEKICLVRNIRGATRHGRKIPTKRPKIISQLRATHIPGLAAEAVKELFPAAKCYPAEYFKPTPWQPTREDVAKYTAFGEEVIRCICGIYLEEGTMVECDKCKSWQHCECVGHIPGKNNKSAYTCDRCSPRPMPREIPNNLPAASNLDNLDCYVTLLVPNCQNFYVRVGDCVYLTKDRRAPVPSALYDPVTVDILRIDKMWKDSQGVKHIWGYHYLRPIETFHEATRSFFENELLKSQHLETARLDAVLGRCCIMDSALYSMGKPKEYPLQHCFICDLKVNKASSKFEAIKSKEKVPLNLSRYCFESYPEKLTVRRTFKPHQVPVLKKKLKAEAARGKSDRPKSDINLVKERCERIHAVLDSLARRRHLT